MGRKKTPKEPDPVKFEEIFKQLVQSGVNTVPDIVEAFKNRGHIVNEARIKEKLAQGALKDLLEEGQKMGAIETPKAKKAADVAREYLAANREATKDEFLAYMKQQGQNKSDATLGNYYYTCQPDYKGADTSSKTATPTTASKKKAGELDTDTIIAVKAVKELMDQYPVEQIKQIMKMFE